MKPSLFSTVNFGAFSRPHRVAMAPMTRRRAMSDGVPSTLSAEYYGQRSSACFIVSEATAICPQGIGAPSAPGIWSREQVAGWRKITQSVRSSGGLLFCQLWHAGRVSHPMINGGLHPLGPSPIRAVHPTLPFLEPKEMSAQDIREAVEAYRAAAKNAKLANFDGIELHAANGYLLDQFIQSGSNHRHDNYGGSVRNRFRFLSEVLDAVSESWEPDRIGIRFSPAGVFNDMSDENAYETFSYVFSQLNTFRPAYVHLIEPCVAGDYDQTTVTSAAIPSRAFREVIKGPLVVAGGYTASSAQLAIEQGYADIVAFGRQFISNPDLPLRLQTQTPLASYDRNYFYEGGPQGYIDYPPASTQKSA